MNQHFVDSGIIVARPPKPKTDSPPESQGQAVEAVDHVIPYIEPEVNPSKTGNKPKQLVAVEVWGYEVGRGRRKRVVNPSDVYNLAAIGCNDREIARWFDLDENTLRYNFSDIIEKGREDLKHSLRRAMIKNALGGNAALQIFLAKNMLGMSDTPTNSEENKPLPWQDE
jgi:hypothetical protein